MARILRLGAVKRDLAGYYAFILERDAGAAERFLKQTGTTFGDLALNPLLGAPRKFIRTRYADSRLWRVNGFPQFLIIYRPIQNGVLVQRVVRAAVDYTRL